MRFRLVPKSSTLDDSERPWTAKMHSGAEKMRLLEPSGQNWTKVDPYMQWEKCRPMTSFWKYKVYADTRRGSSWRWPQVRVGLSTLPIFGNLSGYFFANCRDNASNIISWYDTPCWPVSDCKMNDLEWPWVAIGGAGWAGGSNPLHVCSWRAVSVR